MPLDAAIRLLLLWVHMGYLESNAQLLSTMKLQLRVKAVSVLKFPVYLSGG